MKAAHRDAVDRGFEGIMIRNRNGLYESGKRSADLQKYKEFMDSEFRIVDVVVDKDGLGVLECQNDLNEETFTVTLGSHSERAYQFLFKYEFIGTWVTVKYQSRYKKTLLPQFPTGLQFRDCSEDGTPLE
ncbi:DNA ligase [compost metagenome]